MSQLVGVKTRSRYKFGSKLLIQFGKQYGVDTSMAKDIWSAFKKVKQELRFKPSKSWTPVSYREAGRQLEGLANRHNVKDLAENGTFFRTDDGQVYQEEIDMIKSAKIMFDYFTEIGAILDTETTDGKKIYAIVPQKAAAKLKESTATPYVRSAAKMINHPLVKKWLEEVDKNN